MVTYHEIKQNSYYDSVTLMLFSSKLQEVPGVKEAAVMMATDHNKALMRRAGILSPEQAKKATPNDLVVGVLAESDEAAAEAREALQKAFAGSAAQKEEKSRVKTLRGAVKQLSGANTAVISLPGAYAGREAMNAMKNGLHVLLFSDNVPLEEEIRLKEYACAHDLLMMGPDCGTAMINGAGLGFANAVREGGVGLVAASGTGLQEVCVLLDRMGAGVSQAIGTGGRDGKEAVGGRMMLLALEALARDENTKVIGIIAKPPHPTVMERVLQKARETGKPVVACFLGRNPAQTPPEGVTLADTLEETALSLARLSNPAGHGLAEPDLAGVAKSLLPGIGKGRKYIRGLYTGGTLCYESLLLLNKTVPEIRSNLLAGPENGLADPETSEGHTLLDMGDDYFTNGMPHPMIEPKRRSERVLREARDPEVAVMLFDCVIGYGSHDDPAGMLADAVEEARKNGGEKVAYIASVTGTEADRQGLSAQIARLEGAGITVMASNARAAGLAAEICGQMGRRESPCRC